MLGIEAYWTQHVTVFWGQRITDRKNVKITSDLHVGLLVVMI